jgi:hypothetical protein
MKAKTIKKYQEVFNDAFLTKKVFLTQKEFSTNYNVGSYVPKAAIEVDVLVHTKTGLIVLNKPNLSKIKEIACKVDEYYIGKKQAHANRQKEQLKLDLVNPKIERTQESHNQTTDEWSIFWGLIKFKRQRAQVKE